MKYAYLKYPWGSEWCGMMLFCGKRNILLDSAVEEAFFPFLYDELKKHDLTVSDIDIVANTHSHGDHIGMNEKIVRFSGAEVLSFQHGLQDNSVIDGGDWRLEVIHTPGHSADSISFLELESGVFFSGDTFEGRGTRYAGVALYNDPAALLQTIEKVRRLYLDGRISKMYLSHAYHETGGIIDGADVPSYLDLCRDTILAYDRFIRSLPEDIEVSEAGTLLRKEFFICEEVMNPRAAESTVRAHLRLKAAL